MVKSFRVLDLQTLLSSVGRSKSGLKQDLVSRALRLVQGECSPELLREIRQLYESRFPKKAARAAVAAAAVPVGLGVGGSRTGYHSSPSPNSSSSSSSLRSGARSQVGSYLNGLDKPPQSRQPAGSVKLASLPFYQTLEVLLPPTELGEREREREREGRRGRGNLYFFDTECFCIHIPGFCLSSLITSLPPPPPVPQNSEKLQDTPCTFELSKAQVERIRNSRELYSGLKSVQVVLRLCYADTSGVQEDQYPPNIAIKVNHSYCHVPGYYPSNKPGVEPRRPCRPVNITSYLSTATNRLVVTWGNYGKRYCVALDLVQVLTSEELFAMMKRFSVKSPEQCREISES
ncbi:UNVERIFIED_CONTAM: hypothetical protein FKN15_019357 [Acipenser sinensis]